MANSISTGVAYKDPAIVGGSVDGSPVGATTPSTGAFTTLAVSGATTLSGTVAVGDATSDVVAFYGVSGQSQPASASQTALAASATTKTTTALRAELTAVKTLLARIRKDLKGVGIIKGAA